MIGKHKYAVIDSTGNAHFIWEKTPEAAGKVTEANSFTVKEIISMKEYLKRNKPGKVKKEKKAKVTTTPVESVVNSSLL